MEAWEARCRVMQARLAAGVTRAGREWRWLHGLPFKVGLALLLNGTLVAVGWGLWRRRRPAGLVAVGLFSLGALAHKKAGLIQLVLGACGLGLGYGFGSRFDARKRPQADSDYDLGVFVERPARLSHKRDPRILLARLVLMVLTGKRVDLKQYPPPHFEEKRGVVLLAVMVGDDGRRTTDDGRWTTDEKPAH
ncbi:MAG: nucleotidyltransferase domain-containing protein [Chloroflexi bacterium]|nr:nucleotidyltransferase domain-containing protein [Chloroflexota bacterium]MCI0646642.1 nucleotidyltransferase domain-containing protein [Chloroflexota bacterium]MCI0729225.1 nucleotidyltransferase domain-containing protein [Chloroflexota bacterium]